MAVGRFAAEVLIICGTPCNQLPPWDWWTWQITELDETVDWSVSAVAVSNLAFLHEKMKPPTASPWLLWIIQSECRLVCRHSRDRRTSTTTQQTQRASHSKRCMIASLSEAVKDLISRESVVKLRKF